MRLLLDTNVVLDYVLERLPFFEDAKELWTAILNGRATGFVTASSITDLYYLARKSGGAEKALEAVQLCLDAFEICPVDRRTLEMAVALQESDFEDAVQVACATNAGLDAVVTRDPKGFKSANMPVLTAEEALQRI